ncbi:MAG: hypothetical protein K8H89_00485 [Flavobacteriales bacterium]|jgi:hypothetical protein|nr:hypothetical protein [Flavobacteriales bacterium]
MKTKQLLLALAGSLAMQMAQAQPWNKLPGGDVINTTEWFGADFNSTIPLSIETRANQPINFSTNNIQRMRLTESLPGQVIGSYINENLSGNLGIGAFTSPNVSQPFSLLHLDNGGSQFSGYRPWFRPGMTVTNGSDLGWIGLKNEGGDLNHLTLAWADNTAGDGDKHTHPIQCVA